MVEAISRESGYGTVSAPQLYLAQRALSLTVLDVRETGEVERDGHIPGSVHLSLRELVGHLERLPVPDRLVVVYGATSHQGAMAMTALRLLGYTGVRNLTFGFDGWRNAGLPVMYGPPSLPDETGARPPSDPDDPLGASLGEFLSDLPPGFLAVPVRTVQAELASGRGPLLVDLRGPAQYASQGRIGSAVNLPFEELFGSLQRLPGKDAPIVAYCGSGHRSGIVAMGLRLLGYRSVLGLDGGTSGWTEAGLPSG